MSSFGMLGRWQHCIMVSQIVELKWIDIKRTKRGPEMNLDGHHAFFFSKTLDNVMFAISPLKYLLGETFRSRLKEKDRNWTLF